MQYDVFISHASEDKKDIADPLAHELDALGYSVWYDSMILQIGVSLRKAIEEGLAQCRYGIVILSPSFFEKRWPQNELDGLLQREQGGRNLILPIWHKVDQATVSTHLPMIAGRLAADSAKGLDEVVRQIVTVLGPLESKRKQGDAANRKAGEAKQRPSLSAYQPATEMSHREGKLSSMISWAQAGRPEDIDRIMTIVEKDQSIELQHLSDFVLQLVRTRAGRNRLRHYLDSGNQWQRLAAAMFFKSKD